jgi:plasmid stability protein
MASLTLDIPDELYQRLQRRAEWNQRSLDREALDVLDRGIDEAPAALSTDQLEALEAENDRAVDELRAKGVWITEDEVNRFIEEGRP